MCSAFTNAAVAVTVGAMAFTGRAKDDEIIAAVLDAIAADADATLVAAALREAWNGRDFDDGVLRGAFNLLAAVEAS